MGGGFADAGLYGEYFANTTLSGAPSFTRKDVRIDFDWGETGRPGGSIAPGYRDVGADNFSVRWTGRVIPRFGEAYIFRTTSDEGVRLFIRPAGSPNWTTLVDHWDAHVAADDTGTYPMTAGAVYDLKLEYYEATGPAVIRLAWSSPSTPEEVVDTVAQVGLNLPVGVVDWNSAYTDIVKSARNSWWSAAGVVGMDASGWPTGNGAYVFQESLNQGLALDPLMRGTIAFSFKGKADVGLSGNVGYDQAYTYDPATNTTVGTFTTLDQNSNASFFYLTNATRDGQPANGTNGGITELKMMRPTAPDSTASYATDTTFTPQIRDALGHFTLVRFQTVGSQERDWSDRTLPTYFNQNGGARAAAHYYYPGTTQLINSWVDNPTGASDSGPSWEFKVMLCNETGRDMMICIPPPASGRTVADVDSYVYKLAQLIRYGSDGVNPYTSPHANPVYPPLNPNLRVYFEIGNELWNFFGPFYTDYSNVNAILTAAVDAFVQGNTGDPGYADFQAINYDNQPTSKNPEGVYWGLPAWRDRADILRTMQMSNIFRAVFGDDAMMSRVRPLYEWQYDNNSGTASSALVFADRIFNNGDGVQHVDPPHPISYYLWGGGGATYYSANNPHGVTDLITPVSVAGFESPALPVGYNPAPAGSAWTFAGTAGIARDAGAGDDIPTPYNGSQAGYITDTGSVSIDVTFPASQTSNVYGVAFKAVNRTRVGGQVVDRENLRVYLDDTIDITARTFSQSDGYTPPGEGYAGSDWVAQNVSWTVSTYYYTKTFTATPGSTHRITIRGRGDIGNPANVDQTAFLEDVRVTSVDRIFADGFPGSGEAAGQPPGQNYRLLMNVESDWAKAFGLEMLSYEGGWSLGGDDGGSPLQLEAKYGDDRTVDVQVHALDMFYQSGAAVSVLGTYVQWPSWTDFYAEAGLLDVARYPIIRGVDASLSRLAAEATNGTLLPAILKPYQVAVFDTAAATGEIRAAGGWLAWNVLAPRTGVYSLNLTTFGAGGVAVLLVDDRDVVASGATGGNLVGTATLTAGRHTIKVRSTTAAFWVTQVAVVVPDAPATTTLNPISAGDGSAFLSWAALAGATWYKVRYGTASGVYTEVIDFGPATSAIVTGLTNGRRYYFAVSAYNTAGDGLPSDERGAFPMSGGPPVGTIWAAVETPAIATANDANPIELGVKFRSDVAGSIVGVRFYKGATNTGTHVGRLWNGAGMLLATATFADETASGWQQVTFPDPVSIQPDTTYVVSYHTDVGRYAFDGLYFAGSGTDNWPLHALRNGVDGGNGVYAYGSGSFPGESYNSGNYWVDVVFTLDAPIVTTTALTSGANPSTSGQAITFVVTVTSTSTGIPAGTVTFLDGATMLSTGVLDASGRATFTTGALAVGAHSITAAYGGNAYFAASTSTALTQTVVPLTDVTTTTLATSLNPSAFGQAVAFTATVTSPGTGTPTGTVTFLDGATTLGTGTLDASGRATFTTGAMASGLHPITAVYGGDANFDPSTSAALTQTITISIWVPSDLPESPSENDSSPLEVGVRFTSSQAGNIVGIRFYKGDTNIGTHVGSLWTGAGTLLGRATFVDETPSGWQQVTLANPVPIAANTTYVASYHTDVGQYADDGCYFVAARIRGPLTALANATGRPNGVYAYSATPEFPTRGYHKSNYWVDVVFVPGTVSSAATF